MAALKAPVRAKWISPSLVEEVLGPTAWKSLYEPFAGQAKLSHYFKRRGKRVVAGDLLESHYCFGLTLIEANEPALSEALVADWLRLDPDPAAQARFSAWSRTHFSPEATSWLGSWHAKLATPGLPPAARAMGAVAVALTIQHWLSGRRMGDATRLSSPPELLGRYLQTVATWVFSNGQANQALWGDATHLAPKVEADVFFCYPPTDQGFFDYPDPLGLFECWVKGNPDLILPGLAGEPAGPPTLGLPLAEPAAFAEGLHRLLARSQHFQTWVVAFNDRYPLSEAEFLELIREFRPVKNRHVLSVATGERGAAPVETLIVATSKY